MAKVKFSDIANDSFAIDINWDLLLKPSNDVFGSDEIRDWITVHCTSANVPTQEIKFDTLNIKGNKSRQVVNIDREGDISLEVAESDRYIIQDWLEKVATSYVDPETRQISDKSKYQMDDGIQLVMQDGSGKSLNSYSLKYCTIEAPQGPDVSTGDGTISKVKFNIHYLNWSFGKFAGNS